MSLLFSNCVSGKKYRSVFLTLVSTVKEKIPRTRSLVDHMSV